MRIAFAVDRYWPLNSAASRVLDRVARFLLQRGHEVWVLTAQVDHLWPEQITVRDVPVRRFGLDSWSLFGRKSLGQRIAQWLDKNAEQWDLLVVCELMDGGHYLFQVADQMGKPSLLSFFESGPSSPVGKLLDAAQAGTREDRSAVKGSVPRRSAWLTRKCWTVPDLLGNQNMEPSHLPARTVLWGAGIPETPVPTDSERRQIRAAICQSRASFERYCDAPLVVYQGHCLTGQDSQWLWRFLAGLCERRADVCAWVAGDGPAIHGLWRLANEAGLEDRLIFPGIFNDLSDLYAAADLVVLPQLERRHDHDWLSALAIGTPSLTVRSSGIEGLLQIVGERAQSPSLWTTVLPREIELWWEHAFQVLDQPAFARSQAEQQRALLLQSHRETDTLQQYEQLLIQIREGS